MMDTQLLSRFWDYVIFYAYDDDDEFDGIHDGGIKELDENAPEDAKEAFAEYQRIIKDAEEKGLKV